MALLLLQTIGLAVLAFFLLYYYSTVKLSYWRKRGVKGPKPLPFVGNFLEVFLKKSATSDCFVKAYYDYKDEPAVGVYGGLTPMLVVRDLDLMKDVFIKDFPLFAERTIRYVKEVEPLTEDLFRLEAEKWKPLRAKFSPMFTSGKLKEMFHMLFKCSENLEMYLDNIVATGGDIECRESFARYTTDAISSAAFSLDTNALKMENSEFRNMGRRVFQNTVQLFLTDRLREYPMLFKIFGRFLVDHEVNAFFTKISTETLQHKMKNHVPGSRADFFDVLIDLKEHPEKVNCKEIDDLYIASQVFVFFLAGFKTTSLTLTNATYEFAMNPSIQEKARAEVKKILEKYDGKITYDGLKEMKYLDACFDETLRKYPVLLWLSRVALADYTFNGTKISIEKGQQIYFPIYAIQRDPEIYPNPEAFQPDRFLGDNAKCRHPMTFVPFGDGPRNCIGSRFARMQSEVALVKLLSKYKVEPGEKTVKHTRDKTPLFLYQPKHAVHLKLSKLDD